MGACDQPSQAQAQGLRAAHLSRMPQESMSRLLKFPSTPRCTEIRSTSWALMEMSLRQPWNPASEASHSDPEPEERHPDGSEVGIRRGAGSAPAVSYRSRAARPCLGLPAWVPPCTCAHWGQRLLGRQGWVTLKWDLGEKQRLQFRLNLELGLSHSRLDSISSS